MAPIRPVQMYEDERYVWAKFQFTDPPTKGKKGEPMAASNNEMRIHILPTYPDDTSPATAAAMEKVFSECYDTTTLYQYDNHGWTKIESEPIQKLEGEAHLGLSGPGTYRIILKPCIITRAGKFRYRISLMELAGRAFASFDSCGFTITEN